MRKSRRPNPAYGSGMFRRRLRLHAREHEVAVEVEDSNHGFRLVLRHDGACVLDVGAEAVRYPFVTCPEAVVPLRRLVGARLDAEPADVRSRVRAGDNCTHLHDMAMMALAHARNPGRVLLFDVTVADERDGVIDARVDLDGQPVHHWQIRNGTLEAPAAHAGQPLMQGFYGWASAAFADERLEAALMLQRGYFVAQSRRYLSLPAVDYPAAADNMPDGTCYSFNHDTVQRALRIEGSIRDLTHTPELLLQFIRTP